MKIGMHTHLMGLSHGIAACQNLHMFNKPARF
jgi:hypothetical protein